ncbi:cell wall-active antibiotics response protein LiaF [Gracilibacillus sp. S3-1-1]|uniref:Cell wall-active antibiotics response protein LiaF n=1 Tax=Gracilibacillus pellucidus TaxID=3095368 RepID=A0ACC6M2X1_9BACI|nr:cell wall-active antibiotics response protein LiaF [Gracilibacillus sp. S3-1-1]MDX8045087.1 cell wall-active antibiotics response protein LiaF [Gracilibacillus sp. S3-1-1]
MFKKMNNDLLQIILIIGGILLLLEFIFMDTGLLFLIALGAVLIYFGKRSYQSTTGKTFFWGGAFIVFIAIIDTFVIRFLIFAIVIYFVWHWYQQKQKESKPLPKHIDITEETLYEERVIHNKWFGKYHTTQEGFSWQDMNIQSGVGDVFIDLNDTMLPKEESVMVIRQVAGKVVIIVPYDVEVTIDHTVVFGDIQVFDHEEKNAFNRHVQLQSKGYHGSPQRVKIFTQMIAGKLEVRRG